jgi:hypothetical protein
MFSSNRDDWIWFAGLFEGEGCISFQGVNSVVVNVTSTGKDVIEKCILITGGQIVPQAPRMPHHKERYRLRIYSADKIIEILDRIQPFLCQRRTAKAKEARQRIANMPQTRRDQIQGMIEVRKKMPRKRPGLCGNCRKKPVKARNRCNPCYEYLRRHREDHPPEGLRKSKLQWKESIK